MNRLTFSKVVSAGFIVAWFVSIGIAGQIVLYGIVISDSDLVEHGKILNFRLFLTLPLFMAISAIIYYLGHRGEVNLKELRKRNE